MMNLDDAIYGLRNLSVGDDEQTRIDDYVHEVEPVALREEVAALIDAGKYEDAYRAAIKPVLEAVTRDEVLEAATNWAIEFLNDGDEPDNDDIEAERASLVADIMNEYDYISGGHNA